VTNDQKKMQTLKEMTDVLREDDKLKSFELT